MRRRAMAWMSSSSAQSPAAATGEDAVRAAEQLVTRAWIVERHTGVRNENGGGVRADVLPSPSPSLSAVDDRLGDVVASR